MLMRLPICLATCLSSKFMSIILWPGMTHLVPVLSQNACCGWGAWCHSEFWDISVQFSSSVMFNSLYPHGQQHARLPCPSPAPRAYANSCPSCWWCHSTISSSVVIFSSCLEYFPASGSFPMSQSFPSGGQSIGISASASVLPINIQDWVFFRIDWFDFLAIQGTLKNLLQPLKRIHLNQF